jgi:GNAT superfamily N-acetyltransferase
MSTNARSSELHVRRAAEPDVEVLVQLMREFYTESNYPLDDDWAAASFRALLSHPALGCVWLAYRGTLPVGHAVLTVRYCMEFGGLSGYIDDLFVTPAFRHQGVGYALLTVVFAECRARGCQSVQVEAGASNAPALALYGKFGLEPATDGRVLLRGVLSRAGT